MKWAVTGGSGFLGLHLAPRLQADGHAVRSLDLEPQPVPGVDARVGDVRVRADARWVATGADVLVHAAAALPIRRSGSQLRSVNVAGTQTVLEEAAKAGVRRAILISSAVVYGLQGAPLREDATPVPIEAYGRSKLEAERVWSAGGHRIETVILRPTAFVGPGRLGVFGLLFEWIREGRRIYTIGPGTNRYQLLAVEDLVEAVVAAADWPVAGETYNLGATRFGTVADDLRELIAQAGSGSRVTPLPAAPAKLVLGALAAARLSPLGSWHVRSADTDFVVDVSKARRELAWAPASSNVEALVRAYRSHVAGPGGHRRSRPTHVSPWKERALAVARRLS